MSRMSRSVAITEGASFRAMLPALAKVLVLILAIAIPVVELVRAHHAAHGDFPNHCESARRYLAGGDIYKPDGLNSPYPPFWAMAFAPFTYLPINIAQMLLLCVGVGAFYFLLWLLAEMTREGIPLISEGAFWTAAITGLAALRFLFRDFDEAGPNLILIALSWYAIYLWRKGRDWLAGLPIGLAIALKCTPLLLVVYFALKREWRFVASALVVTVVVESLPVVHQGAQVYGAEVRGWLHTVTGGMAQGNPSMGVLGPEPVQNKSLRPALARYLMHVPPPGDRAIGMGYIYFLNLPPAVAGWVIKVLMAGAILAIGWAFRTPVKQRLEMGVLWEAAAVSILMLLYSPITWGQHCVAILPGLYFAIRTWIKEWHQSLVMPRWVKGLLVAVALLILVPNRLTLGPLADLLETYHYVTFTLVLLLVIVLTLRFKAAK